MIFGPLTEREQELVVEATEKGFLAGVVASDWYKAMNGIERGSMVADYPEATVCVTPAGRQEYESEKLYQERLKGRGIFD